MKKLMSAINSFCWKHPKFGIPRLMLYIIIGNAVVYLVGMMDTTRTLYSLLAFNPAAFCRGQVWRLLTFALVPDAARPLFLIIELYFYYFIGTSLEHAWGSGKFTVYYAMGLLLTALYALIAYWITGIPFAVSANYINFSMFLAFATLWPEQRVLLFYFIPIKVKWLGIADAAYFTVIVIINLLSGSLIGALLPIVAVLNYFVFCGDWLFDLIRPNRVKQKAKTIRFKSAVKKTEQEQKRAGYSRKCSVCGRTDRDYPDLEFRYCSRCQGFHCFCQDHINNHVHFTE